MSSGPRTRLPAPCRGRATLAGKAFTCLRPDGHDGRCLPRRADVMELVARYRQTAAALVTELDLTDRDLWPDA